MRKVLTYVATAILTCAAIISIAAGFITWGTWAKTSTSAAVAQIVSNCDGDSSKKCLKIDVYEALNLMPREDRPLNPSLAAYYNGTSSPPNPLAIAQGDSVTFFVSPSNFLPASYTIGTEKFVPHVGAGLMWPLLSNSSSETIFTKNLVTFNSGDPANPQEFKTEFGHATEPSNDPTSAQFLIASGPITYNNVGEFVATARIQMIRHFYTGCSPSSWLFVPNTSDLCAAGQFPGRHSAATEDRLIDVNVSRLIQVAPRQ